MRETYDFDRSFITWTSTRVNHTPRMRVDAACRIVTGGRTEEFFLSVPNIGEEMYADRDLIHRPPFDFIMIGSPAGEFMFAKTYADPRRNGIQRRRVGEAMSTQDGRGATVTEMNFHMTQARAARALVSYEDVRAAILGFVRLNGRTTWVSPDGCTTAILDYPIRVCNVSHASEQWQIDNGPVLIPDLAAGAPWLPNLRPGYLVYDATDWADICRRRLAPDDPCEAGSLYSAPERVTVHNELLALDGPL
jgi:hypothetical protein